MDQLTPAPSDIFRSYGGSDGYHIALRSNNTTMNTYMHPDMINLGLGDNSGEPGVEGAASRPYRLIPYARNSTFTGRKKFIESIRRLSEPEAHNRIALYGLGGSGCVFIARRMKDALTSLRKTQIALEYVYQCMTDSDQDVFWVQGSGVLKFSEGFKAVAQRVQIPLAHAEIDEEGSLLGIRRWFEGPSSGDWILVVDNADNEADFASNTSPITKFLPQGTKGTLIFTTRSRQVALRQGCRTVEVGKMWEEEALELFSKRFGDWDSLEDEEKQAIAMILDSMDHLPLAVVGSAAFMTETATLPSTYWAMFQESEERRKRLLSQEFSDVQREADMTGSVLGTYFVTFDRIRQQMPTAANLLRLMAFFDRQNIPEELLSKSSLEGMDDLVGFRMAIGKLLGFSLITTVKRGGEAFYELHQLVQLSLQVYLSTEELNQSRTAALKVVSRCFPRSPDERRTLGPTYISHALAVTKHSIDPIAEELCFHMGQYFLEMGSYNNAEIQVCRCIALREKGREYNWDGDGNKRFMLLGVVSECQGKYDESEAINRRVLEECEKVLGLDHPDTLTSLNNLATVLQNQGKYGESEAMNRHALKARGKFLGRDHPDTLTSLSNLATVLQNQGKYDESEIMNRRVLEGYEKALRPQHPDTLASVRSLALVLGDQGKYDESETMNRRALEGYEKVLGSEHPDTLASVRSLALVLGDQGKYDESEMLNRRALEGYEKVLGPQHPNTLASVHNLALVLGDQGKYDESEMLNRRALEGYEKVLGSEHPNTLASVRNLALVLGRQGKYDESETMNRRALEGCEMVLGPQHPDTLASVRSLALVLGDQGKWGESETMNRRALEGYEKVLGPQHPHTLTSVNGLAAVLRRQGKYIESEEMNRRALEGYKRALGPDHPDTLTSIRNLAALLQESEEMNRRTLEERQKALGPDHPHTLATISSLAAALLRQGKYDESENLNRHALEGYENVLGPDHPTTLISVNNLAIALRHQGKHSESEAMNRRALEGYEKAFGPDHPHTLTSVRNLAVVLHDQGKHNESKMMNQRVQGRLPTQPDPTGPRPRGSLVQRFLRTTVFGKNDGPAK